MTVLATPPEVGEPHEIHMPQKLDIGKIQKKSVQAAAACCKYSIRRMIRIDQHPKYGNKSRCRLLCQLCLRNGYKKKHDGVVNLAEALTVLNLLVGGRVVIRTKYPTWTHLTNQKRLTLQRSKSKGNSCAVKQNLFSKTSKQSNASNIVTL